MKGKLKPVETRLSGLMFIYFFLATLSIYVVKPAKESLFMDALGKPRLPYAFLLTAILMGLAVAANSRLIQRVYRPIYVSSTLGFFILTSFVFWLLIHRPAPWPWIFLFFWSWADIFLVTTITQFWIMVNDLLSPREAKRRIGFLVSGGILGGIVGSLVAYFRPARLETENLILVCPVILSLCVLIVFLAWTRAPREAAEEAEGRPGRREEEKAGLIRSFTLLRENRYMLYLSGMMIVAIIISNLVDFQFKALGKAFFPDKNATTSFFACFNLGLLVFSYLLAALVTTRVLKNFGMRVALLIPPVFLLVGSVAVYFLPAGALLVWVIYMRGADKSLAHSLSQSVRELLYIPLPQKIKYRAKVFVDMFLNKFADGLTGLLLLAVSPFLELSPREVSLLAIVLIVIWMGLNMRLTSEYVSIVKRNLQIKWQDADKLVKEKIDVDLTKLVFDTLQSRERSSVLYAMNLFDLIKKEKLSPEVKRLIASKSGELRARAMDSLLDVEGEVLVPEFDDSLGPQDLDARVREIMSLDVYQELMKEKIEKAARGKGEEAEVARMEAAKVMGMMTPGSPLIRELKKLLKDESAEVARYAAESAGRLKQRKFVPLLINLLARPATQEAAKHALLAYGDTIVGTLRDSLADPSENLRKRQPIPDLIARLRSQRAADMLVLELKKEEPSIEAEIVDALHQMRSNAPELVFQEKAVLAKVVSLIRKCYLLILQINDLRADKKKEILAQDLENALSRAMKHVFQLLGLVLPQDDIIRAYQNILVGTRKSLDYSVELLDNIVRKEIKELLLPLIEDTPFEEKVRLSRKMLKAAEKITFT